MRRWCWDRVGLWDRTWLVFQRGCFQLSPQANSWKDAIPPKTGSLKWCWPASLVVSVPPSCHSLEVPYRTNVCLCMCISKLYSMFLSLKKERKGNYIQDDLIFNDPWISCFSVYSTSGLLISVRKVHIWQVWLAYKPRNHHPQAKGGKGFCWNDQTSTTAGHFAQNFSRGRLSHNTAKS